MLPIDKDASGNPAIHYTRILEKWKQWVERDSVASIFYESVKILNERKLLDLSLLHGDGSNTVCVKGGNLKGYCGHKHQKGNKIVSLQDNAGNILAPMTIATVNQSDMIQLVNSLSDLKVTCRRANLTITKNTPLNLDPGFDSRRNRKAVWNVGLKPNIKENPRNRKAIKRGRKRFFDKTIYGSRYKCERTFAWQDKFRRVLIQYEWYQHLFHGFNLLAFALINLRHVH